MITLVGTSHISMEGFEKVKPLLNDTDCLALELCTSRYLGLKRGEHGKPKGLLMRILGYLQKRLGHMTGVSPGADMLHASELARKLEKNVYLIDQPIERTVKKLSRAPLIEKIKLFLPSKIHFNIKGVPDAKTVEVITQDFKKKTPYLYRELIDRRNRHMALCIEDIKSKHQNIIVMVGAGHVPGLRELLGDNITVI